MGDTYFWETVQGAGHKLMVVLTKVDRCHADDLHRNVAEVIAALQPLDRDLVWPYVHAVSAEHDLGMRELRASISTEAVLAAEEATAGDSSGADRSDFSAHEVEVRQPGRAVRPRRWPRVDSLWPAACPG